MRFTMLGLVLGASSMLVACTGTQEAATVYLEDYGTHATALEASMKAHAVQSEGLADVATIGPMEQAHMGDVMGHLGSMGHDVAMMGMCTDSHGGMMSIGGARTLVAQAETECARHEDAMMRAADMSAAMMEEDAHQATMATMMSQMMQMHDQMMSGGMMGGSMMGAGEYACPTANGP
jgi:hypothetical protein